MATIDRFTKFVLTLIAVALIVIAYRLVFTGALATAQDPEQVCGFDPQHPCYVAGWGPGGTVPISNSEDLPIKVLVTNGPPRSVPVFVLPSGVGR
jgi:hypothetical protein